MFPKKKPFPELIFLLVISAIVYIPNIGKLTYFKDDWYYIYDGLVAGAKVFHLMFSADRPARGYFFEIYFSLFGPNPLAYHIGTFFWRSLSAIGAWWLLNILWPKERKFTFFAALLFALYPGYYWWISAIEYQPMIASLALQVFSIALTLKAFQTPNRISRIACLIGAILTGWIYIALVDYAIGMEVFRFLCVFMLVSRYEQFPTTARKIFATIKVWGWNLLIPFGFMFWRIFFFNNERKATDIDLQISGLFNSPIPTLVNWSLNFFNSLLNVGILAWINQIPRFFFGMRLRDMGSALLIAGSVILLLILFEKLTGEENDIDSKSTGTTYGEALFIGLTGTALGITPIIMANRYITIEGFSHYALPASLTTAIALAGFIYMLSSRRVRMISLYAVIALAALAHYGISISALNEENAIEKFWWQASWRIPALQSGTTLVINYPLGNIGDDGYGVMEAPNMIYFPQASAQTPIHYNISAVTLNSENLRDVMLGKLYREFNSRNHTVIINYQNVLILSQPTPTSCVHVIDGHQPLISAYDPENMILAAPSSNIENVIVDSNPFIPQEFAFGAEPEHKWCFYFEKADLASQRGNWDEVASLGEKAINLKLHPQDQSEWMPFLKAYAITGNEERVKQTASKINTDNFLRLQACEMLTNIKEPLTPEITRLIAIHYCRTTKK